MNNSQNKLNKQANKRKENTILHHEWDDDGCCIYCGFDGAEWHHWKHYTYEGQAQPEIKMPRCERNYLR